MPPRPPPRRLPPPAERQFFIDNLLVRIHFIIVVIRWTGLAPWEFDPPPCKYALCSRVYGVGGVGRGDGSAGFSVLGFRVSCSVAGGFCAAATFQEGYRGTSHIRNNPPLGPYSRLMPRALWWSYGGGLFLMSEVLM